jgi:hypothetical protein
MHACFGLCCDEERITAPGWPLERRREKLAKELRRLSVR